MRAISRWCASISHVRSLPVLNHTDFHGQTYIHRLDPRARIVASVAFSIVVAVSQRPTAAGLGLAVSIVLTGTARLPFVPTLKRVAALNVFMALLIITLPFAVPGTVLFTLGPLAYSQEGLLRGATIAVKSNAIVLCLAALIATIEITEMGHALSHLRVPHKLTHLFLLTGRYIGVLRRECTRLANAMRVRCFRPGMNRHTYRSLGYLVGMLLVKSFDRSERVLAAMKCRGFRGCYYLLDHFALGRRDVVFGAATMVVLVAIAWAEWA